MAYRALYRQWRPADFSHVVGQKAVIDTLRNQVINDRIAHAYLFCGSRGTGKTSTAKIMAKAINCDHPENGDPCGKCPNCQRVEHEESLDIIEIDAASNNGVDEMRDLRESVKYPPQFGRYKVYIVDEVHMLTPSAFNALLKTLEEPPAHIVFILATTEPQKLPETILSRCQRFDFGRLSVPEIMSRLREASDAAGADISDGALMLIARSAEGGMRDALSILDMCLGHGDHINEDTVRGILGTSDQSFLFRFVNYLAEENASEIFRMIDELMMSGKEPAVFAKDVSRHVRNLILSHCCGDQLENILDLTQEDAAEYREQASHFTVTRMMKILDLFMALETEMRYASTPRLALENTALKCCIRTLETDQQALIDRIAELENKLNEIQKNGMIVSSSAGEKKVSKQTSPKPVHAATKSHQELTGDSVWNELMNQFKKTEPGLWSMLNHGHIISNIDDQYVWQPASEKDVFFLQTVAREDKKTQIRNALSELTGRSCGFSTADLSKKTASASDSDQAYINTLYQTFGKEPVDVVDSI